MPSPAAPRAGREEAEDGPDEADAPDVERDEPAEAPDEDDAFDDDDE